MVLDQIGKPLTLREIEKPVPKQGQVLIRVGACGVCRTDLHVVDGELPQPKLPLVPGHQIVGEVVELGEKVVGVTLGSRVGVPWFGGCCGKCTFCLEGAENLCDNAIFTGYQVDGGFAEYCVANAAFAFPIPKGYDDIHAAPLLCAGLIGYRSLSMAGKAKHIGFFGFGAAAHLIAQVAVHQGRQVYAFTRQGDLAGQAFARSLGAVWAGDSLELPPLSLDAALIFAPIGELVPQALKAVRKGGAVICAGIHMSDIPSFPYSLLWGERSIKSVANLTRKDGDEFLQLAPQVPVKTEVTVYPLDKANEALDDLRHGRFEGAAVISVR